MTHRFYDTLDNDAPPYTERCYCETVSKEKAQMDMINKIFGNAQGDCFKKNYALFQKLLPTNPHIHFAILDIEYLKSGNRIRHAVVVDGEFIRDVSQGRRSCLDKDFYLRNKWCPVKILAHSLYNKETIPSLDTILHQYGLMRNNAKMIKGDYSVKGRWEASKDSIINL